MRFNYALQGPTIVIETIDCSTDDVSRSNTSFYSAGLSTMRTTNIDWSLFILVGTC